MVMWLYYPPKHPRGIPWDEAVRILDYGGAFMFTLGAVLVLTGVIYTNTESSSSPCVIGLLVFGFCVIVAFTLYEHFMPLKAALTPPHVFAKDKGREFTFPFAAASIINMFYYSTRIAYATMVRQAIFMVLTWEWWLTYLNEQINVLYTDATTPKSDVIGRLRR
jgi:hypothetical protein